MFPFLKLHRNGNLFSDIIINVNNKSFALSKIILSSHNQFFYELFKDNENINSYTLTGVNENDFDVYIDYIYNNDDFEVSETTFWNLLNIYLKFHLHDLEIKLLSYVLHELHPRNYVFLLRKTIEWGLTNFQDIVISIIGTNILFEDISKSDINFEELCFRELLIITRKLALNDDLQESLLEIALKWVKYDIYKREKDWTSIVSLLNWEKISAKYIQDKVLIQDSIFDCDIISSYILEKLTFINDMKYNAPKEYNEITKESVDSLINDSWNTVNTKLNQKKILTNNNILMIKENFPRALMFGGSKRKKDIYMFDTSNHTIEKIGETEQHLQHHRCERLANYVYIFGGYDKLMEGQVSNTFLKYDISNNIVTSFPYKMAAPRYSFASCAMDEILYAFGGKQGSRTVAVTEKFSLEKMKWLKGRSSEAVKDHGFDAIVAKNSIYLTPGGLCALIRRYDPREGKIIGLGKIPTGRYLCTSCKNGDNIYVCGGYSNVSRRECHLFDIRNNSWKSLPPLPVPVYGARSLIYNDNLYVLGGAVDEVKGTNKIQKFNIQTDKWTILDIKLEFYNDSFSLITY